MICLQVDIDKELRHLGVTHINEKDEKGNTALHRAVESGNIELVKKVLAFRGVNPNIQNRESLESALHIASRNGSKDIVECLLEHEFSPRLRLVVDERSIEGTAIEIAIKYGFKDIVECLSRGNRRHSIKLTAYQFESALKHKQTHIAHHIIDKASFDLSKVNPNSGMAPIHSAVLHNNVEIVEALKHKTVDLNVKTGELCHSHEEITPLGMAIAGQCIEAAKLLIFSRNVDVGRSHLLRAVAKGQAEIVHWMLMVGNKHHFSKDDITGAFEIAVTRGNLGVVNTILDHGYGTCVFTAVCAHVKR